METVCTIIIHFQIKETFSSCHSDVYEIEKSLNIKGQKWSKG